MLHERHQKVGERFESPKPWTILHFQNGKTASWTRICWLIPWNWPSIFLAYFWGQSESIRYLSYPLHHFLCILQPAIETCSGEVENLQTESFTTITKPGKLQHCNPKESRPTPTDLSGSVREQFDSNVPGECPDPKDALKNPCSPATHSCSSIFLYFVDEISFVFFLGGLFKLPPSFPTLGWWNPPRIPMSGQLWRRKGTPWWVPEPPRSQKLERSETLGPSFSWDGQMGSIFVAAFEVCWLMNCWWYMLIIVN